MENFVIEIAGVPARVRCRFPANRDFFQGYFSEKSALFSVEPAKDDWEQTQASYDRMDEAEGNPKCRRSDSLLENTAIHTLLAEKLVEKHALLMHGSALCMDGEAYIFTAPSGTGKSTHARFWREVFGDRVWMINDDKPMLKIEESGVTVWGTPWNGKHSLSRNASAPLKAIVWLTRDTANHVEPMTKSEAFPILLKQAFVSKTPETMARILELEKTLLNTVDFYKLGCNMSPEAASVAWEGMNAR